MRVQLQRWNAGARKTVAAASLVLGLAAGTSASAHDATAPADAPHNYLPSAGWVFQHWVPFNEADLAADLRVPVGVLRTWMLDDHHTFADIAHLRGMTVGALSRRLVRESGVAASDRRRTAELRRRTRLVLRDGHLAQHVLFHPFHGPGFPSRARALFGITPAAFGAARQAGRTPLQLAVDRTPRAVSRGVDSVLARSAGRGIATRSTSPAQSARMLARQRRTLPCWLNTPLAKLDPTSPFGDPLGGHGLHKRGTRGGVRLDLGIGAPGGCWREQDPPPPPLPADLTALAATIADDTTAPAALHSTRFLCRLQRPRAE